MKTITCTIGLFLLFTLQSFGQINPVLNLTWEQIYVSPYNYFELAWDEPESPHDELIGYNVYREDELYRFQTETSLYNGPQGSNCDVDFLLYGNMQGFYAHVTAVYNPGPVESEYTQTVWVDGAAIGIKEHTAQEAILYPNPSHGILNVSLSTLLSEPLTMTVFDVLGKRVYSTTLNHANSKVDVSFLENGLYVATFQGENSAITKQFILNF